MALVTDAARGIGTPIAEPRVRKAASVLLRDLRDNPRRAVADRWGTAAFYRHLDIRNESDWAGRVGGVLHRSGNLDGPVNNAGITGIEDGSGPHDSEHVALVAWRAVHRTNLDGTFPRCERAIQAMPGTETGCSTNISSRSGRVGIPAAAPYAPPTPPSEPTRRPLHFVARVRHSVYAGSRPVRPLSSHRSQNRCLDAVPAMRRE